MKLLDRGGVDSLVRELEADAYGLVQARTDASERCEAILLEAFARVAPWFSRSVGVAELRRKLEVQIRTTTAALAHPNGSAPQLAVSPVSDSLHTRIVDLVEEQQSVEPLGRRKAVLGALAGAAIVLAVVAVVWSHFDALATARPTLTDMAPAPNAAEIPAEGDVLLTFGRKPSAKPAITLRPADGVVQSSNWDGQTLTVSYRGLRLATRYTIVVVADYRSRYQDLGRFEQHWSFTTQGYPVVQKVTPVDGATTVFRNGQLSIEFNHRPTVEPEVSFVPNAAVSPGRWSGSVWTIQYSALAPLTSYRATVAVDFGVTSANIQHSWSFVTEPGAPPAGVPVMWSASESPWNNANDAIRLVAIDWSGSVVGTAYQTAVVQQSPDGSILRSQGGLFVDRDGTVVGHSASPYPTVFADDGRSACQLTGADSMGSGQLWISAGQVSGPLRRVVAAGQFGARSGLAIIACSVLNDRVVVVYNDGPSTSAVKVFALSSGRLLFQHSYSSQSPVSLTSSRDGRYLAELTSSYDAQAQRGVGTTVIRRTTDGAIVARLANQRIVQFSWDDARIVVASLLGPNDSNEVDLLDWQSGRLLWRQPLAAGIAGSPIYALAEPHGSRMLVAIATHPGTGDVDQLWLVRSDGTASQVLDGVFYPLFASIF